MSIRIMNRVWEHSEASGSELVLMLALADHAGDDGYCYPRQDSLAEKARVTRRHIMRLLEKCEERGELFIQSGRGRKRGELWEHNRYIVTVGMDADELAAALMHHGKMNPTKAAKVAQKVMGRRGHNRSKSNVTSGSEVMGHGGPKLCDMEVQSNGTPMSHKPSDQPSDQPPTNHQGDGLAAAPDLITATASDNGDGGGSLDVDAAGRTPAEVCQDFWTAHIGMPSDKARTYIAWALERLPVDEVLRSIQKTAANTPKNPDAYFWRVTQNAAAAMEAAAPGADLTKLKGGYRAAADKLATAAGRSLTEGEATVFHDAQWREVNVVVLDSVVRGVADSWQTITHTDNVAKLLAHRLEAAADQSSIAQTQTAPRGTGVTTAGSVAKKMVREVPKDFTPRRMQ